MQKTEPSTAPGSALPMTKSLNHRHRRFVAEYLVDLNATAAYRRAGYKARGHSAEASAARLLNYVRSPQQLPRRGRRC